jgi:DNA-directed RNA polymerase subunit RPC12/RpoP
MLANASYGWLSYGRLRYDKLTYGKLRYGRLDYEFHRMTMKQPTSRFDCPHCGAQYTLVRVEAESAKADEQIACRDCGGPLDGHDGRFILKYFLVYRPTRADRSNLADRARREAHRQGRSR